MTEVDTLEIDSILLVAYMSNDKWPIDADGKYHSHDVVFLYCM